MEIQKHQDNDHRLRQLKRYCVEGWPDTFSIDKAFLPYWSFSEELTVQNLLQLKGTRIVIPGSLQAEILRKLHEGHLGITKCRERSKHSVWWPGLSKELTDMITACDACAHDRTNLRGTLLPSEFPCRPRSMNYFSRFFEVAKLTSTTSEAVVEHFKSIFAHHGIAEVVWYENGLQFASECFQVFAQH